MKIRRRLGWGLALVFVLAAGAAAQESDAEQLLARADELYENGNYKLAIGVYLEAAGMSQRPLNQSRAYFGLALCFFYERDTAAAAKYLRKVAEVDPNKNISELFYPKTFVDLFDRVMREAAPPGKPPASAVQDKPAAPAGGGASVPAKKPGAKPIPERPEPAAGVPARAEPEPAVKPVDLALADERPGGHFEISAHFSAWTVEPILSLFESSLTDKLAEEIQNEVVKKVGSSYSGLVKAVFTPTLALDSEGSNYGLEVRYYARGWAGTFSFGLGLEQTRIKLGLTGSVAQTFTNGSRAEVEAEAFVETNPICPHISFRWELGRPEAAFKPFFAFGLGMAPLKGTFTYSYAGTYVFGPLTDTIEDTKTKTFAELSEDIDFDIPDFLPVIQLHFGFKLSLVRGLSFLGEAGLWDGLLLRGGVGFRF